MMLLRGLCKEGIQLCMVQTNRWAGTYSRPSLKNHYEVLGVERKATSKEIKNAFLTLSKKCHPDSDPTNPLLHSQFVRLNEAYRVLIKHSSRVEYDQILEAIQRADWRSKSHSPYKSYSTIYNWKQSSKTQQGPFSRSKSEDDEWYWSQFPPESGWKQSTEGQRQKNILVVLYCFLVGSLSILMHFAVYSSFRDIRLKENEEQMKILQFYSERREAARVNGLSKQQEAIMQRHEERLRQLYERNTGDETRK